MSPPQPLAFTPPAAAPAKQARTAAAIAGVCERLAQHEAAVAKRSAAARIAWEAELSTLRTSAKVAPSDTGPAAQTDAQAVLQARLKRIVGEPAVLVREDQDVVERQVREQKRIADDYYARMAGHGWLLNKPVQPVPPDVHPQVVRPARDAGKTALVQLQETVSNIVTFPPKHVSSAVNQPVPTSTGSVQETMHQTSHSASPTSATNTSATTFATAKTVQQHLGDPQPSAEAQGKTEPVGVQRPSLIDAVVRIVQKWMDNIQDERKKEPDEKPVAPPTSAAAGAAQLLAVLFSIGTY